MQKQLSQDSFKKLHTKGTWTSSREILDDVYAWEVKNKKTNKEIITLIDNEISLENEANIKLITKAPELLDACIQSLKELERISGNQLLIEKLTKTIKEATIDEKEEEKIKKEIKQSEFFAKLMIENETSDEELEELYDKEFALFDSEEGDFNLVLFFSTEGEIDGNQLVYNWKDGENIGKLFRFEQKFIDMTDDEFANYIEKREKQNIILCKNIANLIMPIKHLENPNIEILKFEKNHLSTKELQFRIEGSEIIFTYYENRKYGSERICVEFNEETLEIYPESLKNYDKIIGQLRKIDKQI